MKVGYFVSPFSPLLVAALLASSCNGVSGGRSRIFEYFFGGIDTYGQRVEDRVEEFYYEYNGGRSVSRSESRSQGERAVRCLAGIAQVDLDRFLPSIPFIKSIVFKSVYEAFASQEDIDAICIFRKTFLHFRQQRRQQQLELEEEEEVDDMPPVNKSGKETTSTQIHQRALATPAEPEYPSQIPRYVTWARSNIGNYILDNDLTLRMDPGSVANSIQNSLARLRGTRIGLVVPRDILDTGCRIAGWVEFVYDPGDTCRIISEAVDIGVVIVQQAIEVTRNEQTYADTHNELIDSAEFQAILANAQTLVSAMA